ncbi:SIS domain-containing protein [Bacillus niameyensis]|uniref:SIS domain-containing protein n=1 Tax=Bacillus niameyensis TaxID=1522308 RepID=UPI0007815728|nr:SIS domain-containing protein [Bacillus niameyensis]
MTIKVPEVMLPAFERISHPFHVWDGIISTPESLSSILQERLSIQKIAHETSHRSNVHLLGCGSSYFSAIAGTYFFHEVAGINAFAHQAWEFSAYPIPKRDNRLYIAISHTGSTPVVLDSINSLKGLDVSTIGLTDVEDSPLAEATNHVILGKEGREPAIPKTRSYVVSLLKHYLLAIEMGAIKGFDVLKYKEALESSPKLAKVVITENDEFTKQLGSTFKDLSRVFVLGAGPNRATAYEASLKLKEIVHLSASGWQLEEGMHGPWVSMKENDLVILIATKGSSFEKARKFVSAIKEIGTKVWVITNAESIEGADYVTNIPDVPENVTPLYTILPIYQFAYQLALAKGIHPDIMNLNNESYLKTRLSLPR